MAAEKMTTSCAPYKVKVLEEGEVVVGQETKTAASESDHQKGTKQVETLFGILLTSEIQSGKDTTTASTTTALKEWQISYVCDQESKAL